MRIHMPASRASGGCTSSTLRVQIMSNGVVMDEVQTVGYDSGWDYTELNVRQLARL